jgi:hypothetical protein
MFFHRFTIRNEHSLQQPPLNPPDGCREGKNIQLIRIPSTGLFYGFPLVEMY